MGNGQWAIEEGDVETADLPGFGEAESPISDFRDLEVWKLGMTLATTIYRQTAHYPREELYGMISQMRRAAVSIPTNTAEGYGRHSSGAYVNFLKIALGSSKELETLLELSRELRFLPNEEAEALVLKVQRIAKMLVKLARAIERQRR